MRSRRCSSFPQKVTLGAPVRLQARSRRRFVATNFLRFAEAQPESIFHIIRRKLCIARDDFSLKNHLSLTPLRPTSQTSSLRSLGDSPRCGEMSPKVTEGTAAVSGASRRSCLLTHSPSLHRPPDALGSFPPCYAPASPARRAHNGWPGARPAPEIRSKMTGLRCSPVILTGCGRRM